MASPHFCTKQQRGYDGHLPAASTIRSCHDLRLAILELQATVMPDLLSALPKGVGGLGGMSYPDGCVNTHDHEPAESAILRYKEYMMAAMRIISYTSCCNSSSILLHYDKPSFCLQTTNHSAYLERGVGGLSCFPIEDVLVGRVGRSVLPLLLQVLTRSHLHQRRILGQLLAQERGAQGVGQTVEVVLGVLAITNREDRVEFFKREVLPVNLPLSNCAPMSGKAGQLTLVSGSRKYV